MSLLPVQKEIATVIGYTPLTDGEASEAYPVEQAFPASRIRPATEFDFNAIEAPCVGWPMVMWKGSWYAAPYMEEVEEWVFDSICMTPEEEEVEPDHPDSWLSILGLI